MSTSQSSFFLNALPDDLDWVNCAPIALAKLRGRATLLYFFASSSIYCQQLSHEIKLLEAKFSNGLNVIGIHTPKFSYESESANVLKCVNRWSISHPVINDAQWRLWRMLNIQAWPTMVLLDAEGKISGVYFGDGHKAELESRINQLLNDAQMRGIASGEPPPNVKIPETNGFLSFPSHVIAGVDRLYLSDTGHNRVLEMSFEGQVTRIFGSGNPGLWDGRGIETGFRAPTGLCLGKDQLFICDTGNHVIRRVRLTAHDQIDTIAGTGKMAAGLSDPGAARAISMASPTGCMWTQDKIFVTQSGQHQIWMVDLIRNTARRIAGSGQDGFADGSAAMAAFSKPNGITLARDGIYISDANNSAIRHISLTDFSMRTVVGEGGFEFGDADGSASTARLQHPSSVHFDSARNVIWIADSYNNKIKLYSIAKNEFKTLNVNYKLHEPQGLTIADNALWIVNTNAHELLRLDLKTGKLARINVAEPER